MRPTFFTDRDLGLSFPAALKAAGILVERHCDHFAPETPDAEWITAVGDRGWIAVTRDRQIRYRPNEREAVLGAGIGLLVLIGKAPHRQLAQNFVNTINRIESFAAEHRLPFIAKVYRPSQGEPAKNPGAPGRIEIWLP